MSSPNWLDRTIGWLSPERGNARIRARVLSDAMLAYEGARSGRRTDGWVTANTSGDGEVGFAHQTMRDRARDLVRNNPYASSGLKAIVANKVGTGIMCQPIGPNRRTNKRLNDRWLRWVDVCDITGKSDLYGLQAMAERTRAESGEVLVRLIKTGSPKFDGDVPLRLKVLEPDFIDSSRNEILDSRREIRYGIETFDGVPVAYWLFDNHPGDSSGPTPIRNRTGYLSQRFPSNEVLHYFKPLRPGQSRGMTDFAPVMLRLRAIDDYDDAELLRKKIAACLAVFISAPTAAQAENIFPSTFDDQGRRVSEMNPGMIVKTPLGSNVTIADPKPSSDYESFANVQLRAVSAGLGIPFELLTTNMREVNYSSARISMKQFLLTVESDLWQWTIPQLCRPICQTFAAAAGITERGMMQEISWRFTPPRIELLDPSKEVPPMVQAIQAGLDSLPNTLRREGYDWLEKLDEIEECNRELDARGIVLTSDARTQIKQAAAPPGDEMGGGGEMEEEPDAAAA